MSRSRKLPRRRPKGTGGKPYQDPRTGYWVAERTVCGRRLRRKAKTPALAEARLKRAIGTQDARGPLPDDPTVGEWLAEWLRVAPDLKFRTRRGYAQIVANHLDPALGKIKLRELTRGQVRTALDDITRQGRSAGTVRNVRNCLSAAMRSAMERDIIAVNPALVRVAAPKNAARTIVVSERLIVSVLEAMHDHPLRTYWATMLYAALRAGEVAGLDWADLSIKNRTLTIRQEATIIDDGTGAPRHGLGAPKTAKSMRTVPIAEELFRLMLPMYRAEGHPKSGLIWHDDQGRPLRVTTTGHQFHALLQRAGISGVTQHTLRHLGCSWLIARGVPIPTVAKMAGHSSPATTAAIYAHVVADMDHSAVANLTFFGIVPPEGSGIAHKPPKGGVSDTPPKQKRVARSTNRTRIIAVGE